VSRLRVTPIGTCRIHTPLKRAAARYPLEVDLGRNYGFVHTSGEALQLVQFLQADRQFRPEVLPLFVRDGDLTRFDAESWQAGDLHLVEISSGKRLMCGPDAVQLNYVTRHFADFFASRERTRQFWSLLRKASRQELFDFLNAQPSYQALEPADRELLTSLTMEQLSFGSVKSDMAEIVERLGRDRLVFVTHINALTPDGTVIPSRDRVIRWVKLAARELDVQCFDPTDYLEAFGQRRALEQDGLDLTHYTPAFADHIYDALHRTHVSSLITAVGDAAEDTDRQSAILAAQFEAMLQFGDFVEVSRQVHEALRKTPDQVPLVELRGVIRSRIGDYEGALADLRVRDDDTAMSQPVRVALLEALNATGNAEQALKVAENLIADEFENSSIYRVAAAAAEKLGNIAGAIDYAKHAFRSDRRDVGTALHALMMLNRLGQSSDAQSWHQEILENIDASAIGAFQVCTWAIDNKDESLFTAAIPAVVASDKAGAIDLLESALNAGLHRGAASGLHLLGKINEFTLEQRRRSDIVVTKAVEEASTLLERGQTGDAFSMAQAARLFRVTAVQSRNLIREITQSVRHNVREAYLQGDPATVAQAATGTDDIFIGVPKTVVIVARSLASLERKDEALALLKRGQAVNPDSFLLRRWTGRFAALQGDYATALRMYGSLDRADPEFTSVSVEVDRFFASAERRALRQLRELFEADRTDEAFDLADAMRTYTGAVATVDRELSRKHRNLRLRLIEIEQGDGEIEEREPILRMMVRISPDDPSALRRLALECMRQFRFADAAQCWERLCALTPSNESVIRNRERCQILAQRSAGAMVEAAA